jgi:hypothetical protein
MNTANVMIRIGYAAMFIGSLLANDGSGIATPAGGIQLRREARISMEKERLTITDKLVTVEYEFLNESDPDITTEVIFPMPAYGLGSVLTNGALRGIDGFHVWVDGNEVTYKTQTKALVGNTDYYRRLKDLGIDPEEFGHFLDDKTDLAKIPKIEVDKLVRDGVYDGRDPLWLIEKTHHWTQTFPRGRILRVKHEYKPVLGLEYLDIDDLRGKARPGAYAVEASLKSVCLEPMLRSQLIKALPENHGHFEGAIDGAWVDYILTTANTWKTPIKDFQMVIERPKNPTGGKTLISLCWDGPLERKGQDTFIARKTNFVPRNELRVMFFQFGK